MNTTDGTPALCPKDLLNGKAVLTTFYTIMVSMLSDELAAWKTMDGTFDYGTLTSFKLTDPLLLLGTNPCIGCIEKDKNMTCHQVEYVKRCIELYESCRKGFLSSSSTMEGIPVGGDMTETMYVVS